MTRITNLSVLILSSLIYSSPIFWIRAGNDIPLFLWSVVLTLICLSKLVLSSSSNSARTCTLGQIAVERGRKIFLNRFFNFACLFVFAAVVGLSGGFSVFFLRGNTVQFLVAIL